MTPLSKWQQQFPHCLPVAHLLKGVFPDRWVRFHSLPGSRRYLRDEADYATLLHRHNGILGQLTGQEWKVVLLSTGLLPLGTPEGKAAGGIAVVLLGGALVLLIVLRGALEWNDVVAYWAGA